MKRTGLIIAVLASLFFGTSGAFIKPLLEAGWSPTAAVTIRTLIAGIVLTPFALASLRGKWHTMWLARWRILGMAIVGVVATQLAYFFAIQRIAVGSAVLIEYLAPVMLVLFAWATTRRMPRPAVIIGSLAALAGLVLVVGPGNLGHVDALGFVFAFIAAVGCAAYYLIGARPSEGLPGVALAWSGLLLGSLSLALVGAARILPFEMTFGDVPVMHVMAPWWVAMLIVAVVATAGGYAASIIATGLLGSRLMSFVALLEVVFATMFAWLALGEHLSLVQLLGGVLILAGIVFVQSEKERVEPVISALPDDAAQPVQEQRPPLVTQE